LICAAHSAGIDAIDTPYMALDDADGLTRSAQMALELGFDGKSAIHPKQIAAINEAFSPSLTQVGWAKRVIEALQAESGAAVLDGQFLDAPHLERARRVLAIAQRLAAT
jgi:citrate lyase beta subunit